MDRQNLGGADPLHRVKAAKAGTGARFAIVGATAWVSYALKERAMSVVQLDVWLRAVEAGLRDLARDGMGYDHLEIISHGTEIPQDMPGAFIPLLAPEESVQVGLVSTVEGGRSMARALLQMKPDEEISQSDLTDALGEAANMLAGFVKRNMQDHVAMCHLGLPLYVNGHLETSERVRAAVTHLKMGEIPIAVIVLRSAAWTP